MVGTVMSAATLFAHDLAAWVFARRQGLVRSAGLVPGQGGECPSAGAVPGWGELPLPSYMACQSYPNGFAVTVSRLASAVITLTGSA